MPVNAVGPDALIGQVVDGRYSVLERIATGGMATVYRAVDTRLDRDVALKVMRPHLANDEDFVSRFKREARAAARLSHPNIVSVFDQGQDVGQVWLAMEYVPGRTLRDLLEEQGPLTPRAALQIFEPLLTALAEAHAHGLIHRDVKPENVLIRDDGVVKVADFGLARAVTTETATSATSEVLGTLSYISPEQVEGANATPRSDVYAAGLILFEMLTGVKAFAGESIPHVLFQHLHNGVPDPSSVRPGVPPQLDALVRHAAAKAPSDRPSDAAELLAETRRVRGDLPAGVLDAAGEKENHRPEQANAPSAAATTVLPIATPNPASGPNAQTQPFLVSRRGGIPAGAGASAAPLASPARPRSVEPATPAVTPAHARPEPPAVAAPPPRRRRRGIPLGILAVLVAAAAAGWYFLAGPGAPATVPQLIGLTVSQATAALDRAHLDARRTEGFSENVRSGHVISATPGEGASLTRGADVTLVISKGKERYAVPEVVGITQKSATNRLAKANLEANPITTAFSDTVDRGRVISSRPTMGTELKKGQSVALVVSAGPEPVDVPDLLGRTPEDAQAIADRLGVTLTVEPDEIFSSDYDKGTIAGQNPADGTVVRGDSISVQVSKGPELIEVPGCFNKSEAESVALLEAAGFEVKVDRFLGAPLDRCTGQSPAGGTMAPVGSLVTITIV